MFVRLSVAIYIFIVATIELTVAGRSLRIDLGSLGYALWKRPLTLLFVPPAFFFAYSLGGVNGVISCILIATPFAAYTFGLSITKASAPGLWKFFWALWLLALVQWAVGNDLVGFIYDGDGENRLPYAILGSEPSFSFEALFAQAMLLLVLIDGRRGWYPLAALLLLSALVNVMTVWQNAIVLVCTMGFAWLQVSRDRVGVAIACLVPTFLIYVFSDEAFQIGQYILFKFQSWRQVANAIAIGKSGWYETLFFDYRGLIGNVLWDLRAYTLTDWIESAFSWFPFVHSIGGRVMALGLYLLIFLRLPNLRHLTWRERTVLVASLVIFLYTAPKWQFFGMINAGAIAGLAMRRSLEAGEEPGPARRRLKLRSA